LALKIKDNPAKKVLSLEGFGENLLLNTSLDDITLEPVAPYFGKSIKAFYLENPTDYPITVYCADFDQEYKAEEEQLAVYSEYSKTNQVAELPVRSVDSNAESNPGAKVEVWDLVTYSHGKYNDQKALETKEKERRAEKDAAWKAAAEAAGATVAVIKNTMRKELIAQLGRTEELTAAEAEGADIETVFPLADLYLWMERPVPEAEDSAEAPAEPAEGEEALPKYVEDPLFKETVDWESGKPEDKTYQQEFDEVQKELGLDPVVFPNKALPGDRVNVVVHGPIRAGRAKVISQVHATSQRGILNVDSAIDWALSGGAKGLLDEKLLDELP
jgi:hypothetical protein